MRPLMRMTMLVPVLVAVCAGCQQPTITKDAPLTGSEGERPGISTLPLTGTSSCSNRGCHASMDQSNAGEKPLECSFTLFYSQGDPHARAWHVLSSKDKAKQMARLLHPDVPLDKDGISAVAKDRRCLACHATPQSAFDAKAFDDRGLARRFDSEWQFGVGCESCHGRANAWREAHYQESWKKKSAKEKEELGFEDLTDLRKRALVCAGCHVGAPADDAKKLPLRDMNHDHVASGHPRLMFEFVSFLSNLPPHWLEKNQSDDFAARAWVLGQLAAAEAAMRLTEDRAKAAGKDDRNRPWPELTEYDCYACHQQLGAHSWRVELPRSEGLVGRLRPSRWYTGTLSALGALPDDKGPLPTLERDLRQAHRSPEAVAKSAADVGGRAREQGKKLSEQWSGKKDPVGKERFLEYRKALIERGKKLDQLTWDECEQIALGLLALERGLGNKAGEEQAMALLKLLAFPPGQDSKPDFRQIVRDRENKKTPFDEQWRELFGKLK